MHNHREIRRLLRGCHAEPANFLRQFRQRLRHPVLHLHLRLVDVRAQVKSHRERHHAVAGGLRKHVERVFDTVDFLFERRSNRFRDGLRICAGIRGAHHDGGRDHFGIFADRQPPHRDEADKKHKKREHAGKNRAADEKM